MRKIIINADDLGRNKVVDDAIEKCMMEGTINSSSIMANGCDFAGVKAITERHPEISYGVHLVIDEMECLTKPQIFIDRGIMDESGAFIKGGIRKAKIDATVKTAVHYEWCAQIEKIVAAGIAVDHLDSHHHLHTMPELFRVLKKVSEQYEISRVRINSLTPRHLHIKPVPVVHKTANDSHSTPSVRPSLVTRIINVSKSYIEYSRLHSCFETTDLFCSVSTYWANKKTIDSYAGFKSIELMCHPGNEDYEDEMKMLNGRII